MLTGRPPWFEEQSGGGGGFAVFQLLYRIAESSGPPPMPPAEGMPPGLSELLLSCFERETARRPDSATLLRSPWVVGEQSTDSRGQGVEHEGYLDRAHGRW